MVKKIYFEYLKSNGHVTQSGSRPWKDDSKGDSDIVGYNVDESGQICSSCIYDKENNTFTRPKVDTSNNDRNKCIDRIVIAICSNTTKTWDALTVEERLIVFKRTDLLDDQQWKKLQNKYPA